MARHDLREMAAGRVDPAGRDLTARSRNLALVAVVFSFVGLAGAAAFSAFVHRVVP